MKEFILNGEKASEKQKKEKVLGVLMAKCEDLRRRINELLAKKKGTQAGELADELEKLIETMEDIKENEALEAKVIDKILEEETVSLEVQEFRMDGDLILGKTILVVDVALPKKIKVAGIEDDEEDESGSGDEDDEGDEDLKPSLIVNDVGASSRERLSGVINIKNGVSNVDYGGNSVSVILKVEGEDGLIVGTTESTDGYRGHFGAWYRIGGLTGEIKVVGDLGKGLSWSTENKLLEADDPLASNVNTIQAEKGMIIYGTNRSVDLYPRGFLRIERST